MNKNINTADMRVLAKMGLLNLGMIACMAAYAYKHKDGLYFPSMLYLVSSPVCRVIIASWFLWFLLVVASLLQSLLIGPRLRAIEATHLREYGWLTISEFLLSMTTFRDDFTVSFLVRFACLMVVKAGHWLSRDRMEYMEETEELPPLYHERMIGLFSLVYLVDLFGLVYCCRALYRDGPSSLLLFATEFGLMLLSLLMTVGRYALNVQDAKQGEPWEHRSTALFYIDLIGDLCKLSVCLIFFFLTIRYYGFPLHMFRDMLMTGAALTKRIGDMLRYRRAMAELDRRYPTVGAEELAALADRTCIICREEMTNAGKKLHCGHYFHVKCLQSWMERQQVCPTCRGNILSAPSPVPSPVPQPQAQPVVEVEQALPQRPQPALRMTGTEELLDRQIDNFHEIVRSSQNASRERIKKLQELSDSLRRTTELIAELQDIRENQHDDESDSSSESSKSSESSDSSNSDTEKLFKSEKNDFTSEHADTQSNESQPVESHCDENEITKLEEAKDQKSE